MDRDNGTQGKGWLGLRVELECLIEAFLYLILWPGYGPDETDKASTDHLHLDQSPDTPDRFVG
ncbi:MAG: hypothetical protein WEC83_00825 [Patescibacteria group bacterium]